jgi:hypothetical protein
MASSAAAAAAASLLTNQFSVTTTASTFSAPTLELPFGAFFDGGVNKGRPLSILRLGSKKFKLNSETKPLA